MELLDALELGLPAGEVGVGPLGAGLDLGQLGLGAGEVGLGHLLGCLCLGELGLGLLDRGHFLFGLGVEFWDAQHGEHLTLDHLGPDVHVPFLHVARDLGVDRGHLVRFDLPGFFGGPADRGPPRLHDFDAGDGRSGREVGLERRGLAAASGYRREGDECGEADGISEDRLPHGLTPQKGCRQGIEVAPGVARSL